MEDKMGKLSSSEVWKIVKQGKGTKLFTDTGFKYIKQKVRETITKQPNSEVDALPLIWGKNIEQLCFEQLGTEYTLESKKVLHHPTIKKWCGTPDGLKNNGDVVYDIKCPYTLDSFFDLILCDSAEKLKEDFPEYYWQLLSNLILSNANKAELIIFVPTQSQKKELKEYFPENSRILFYEDSFPLMPDNLKNLFIFEYEFPKEDKTLLEDRIKKAAKEMFDSTVKYEKILKK